ncbi:MAG: PQQ-dependent sugar dehydrogenase [Actinobacteria bacterium]|nr:PQQ-dependent sugar dehydrogenase [Actinomycetota bacterium]
MSRSPVAVWCLALAAALGACSGAQPPGDDGRDAARRSPSGRASPRGEGGDLSSLRLALRPVTRGLDTPVFATAPADDPRLFVVERGGRVRIVARGRLAARPFLDVSDRTRTDGEYGLLGLAFHPGYARNGRFFVHYSARANGATVLAEYRVSDDPDRADPGSGRTLLRVPQPAPNHNGGMLAFGPDGMLWLGLGDGGGGGDTYGNGQRPDTLLGTLLRLDVDTAGADGGRGYAVPPDNPWADGGPGAPEVWAYGLRNPWRFSFDRGLVYIGDVGQRAWEEVDVARADRAALNYGWPVTEGRHCYEASECDTTGLTAPLVEYSHDTGVCSVIGGYVYRGAAIPALRGHYLHSDLCAGWVRSFKVAGRRAVQRRDWTADLGRPGTVLSLGRDAGGEVYLLTAEGALLRVVARGP